MEEMKGEGERDGRSRGIEMEGIGGEGEGANSRVQQL